MVSCMFWASGIFLAGNGIKVFMNQTANFDESYRVIAVDDQNLVIRGTLTGDILMIANATPDFPLTSEEYPIGKLISLTIPTAGLPS